MCAYLMAFSQLSKSVVIVEKCERHVDAVYDRGPRLERILAYELITSARRFRYLIMPLALII